MASEVGSTLKTVSPILSAIPVVGGIFSGITSFAGGMLEKSEAEAQAKQAEELRKNALKTETQALRPEFLKAERIRKMQALQGLAGKDLIAQNIDETIAANLRSIKESSPQGATATAAISALVNKANTQKRELGIKDAQIKYDATGRLSDTAWDIGGKMRDLEDKRDLQRNQGLLAASAFENAATANKMNANNKLLGTASSTITSILNNLGTSDNSGFDSWYQSYLQAQQATKPEPNISTPQVDNYMVGSQNLPTAPTDYGTPIALTSNSFWQ